MTDFTLTPEDNGKQIKVSCGDLITIKIPENPIDGYKWDIAKYDDKKLKSVDSTFSQLINSESSKAGIRAVTFTAQSSGATQINLRHWRAWEGQDSITDQYRVTIDISD